MNHDIKKKGSYGVFASINIIQEVKMYHFNYVSSNLLSPVKKDLISIMNAVQDSVRHDFTLQFEFVGSVKRQMVTQDTRSNVGFDFDVNIQ